MLLFIVIITNYGACAVLTIADLSNSFKSLRKSGSKLYFNLDKSENALCLEDDNHAECKDLYRFPNNGNSNLQGITSVEIDGEIKYVSPKLFSLVFENLEELDIKNYNSPTITIPITKKSLKTFRITGRKLENIKVGQDLLPITETFQVTQRSLDTDPPTEHFKLGQIEGGPSMKSFFVETSANIVDISLPNINSKSNIKEVEIIYLGKNSDNVKLSYKGTEGKIDLMKFVLENVKLKSLKHLLPPISKFDNVAKITEGYVDFYNSYELEEWNFHKSIAANMKVVTKQEDSSSLKLFSKLSPIKILKGPKEITVDFIIADIATIMLSISDKGKSYIVNTYFLVLDEMYSDSSLLLVNDVTINFRVLIVVDLPRFFGYKYRYSYRKRYRYRYRNTIGYKTITFQQSKSIMDIWKPFTIESFYAIIADLLDAIKPSFMTENESFIKVRGAIANSLLDDIDIEGLKKKFKSDTSYNYLDGALKKINELKLFFNTLGKKARRLPRLSPSLYKAKTLIYHEVAKSLIEAERHSATNAGQGILLDISEKKSKTEKNIATKLQELLEEQEEYSLATLQKLKDQRLKFEAEYKKNSKNLTKLSKEGNVRLY